MIFNITVNFIYIGRIIICTAKTKGSQKLLLAIVPGAFIELLAVSNGYQEITDSDNETFIKPGQQLRGENDYQTTQNILKYVNRLIISLAIMIISQRYLS